MRLPAKLSDVGSCLLGSVTLALSHGYTAPHNFSPSLSFATHSITVATPTLLFANCDMVMLATHVLVAVTPWQGYNLTTQFDRFQLYREQIFAGAAEYNGTKLPPKEVGRNGRVQDAAGWKDRFSRCCLLSYCML